MSGKAIAPNGVLKSVEVYGSSHPSDSLCPYKVFCTGYRSLQLITPARLDAYVEQAWIISEQYLDAWAIV